MSGWTKLRSDFGEIDCFEPSESPAPYALLHLRDRAGPPPPENPILTAELQQHRLRAYSPAVDGCWWVDARCDAFDAETPPLHWLQFAAAAAMTDLWNVSTCQIGLLGTGVGGNGVLQLAYRFPMQFPVVAAIAPAVDFHTHYDRDPVLQEVFANAEAARQETATLRIHPLNWPPHQWFACDPRDPDWFEGCERLASKLSSIGILHESDLTTSAGGQRDKFEQVMLPKAIESVVDGLRQVSSPLE